MMHFGHCQADGSVESRPLQFRARDSGLDGVTISEKRRAGPPDKTMKNLNQEAENADPLREILRSWTLDASLPPRFQEQVWERIARTEAQPQGGVWDVFVSWAQLLLGRPKVALSYVTVLLALGTAAGSWMAQVESSRVDEALGKRYVQSVDPYQAVALNQ